MGSRRSLLWLAAAVTLPPAPMAAWPFLGEWAYGYLGHWGWFLMLLPSGALTVWIGTHLMIKTVTVMEEDNDG